MLATLLASIALAPTPIALPSVSTWDGKSFAGIPIGMTENDLGKQVQKGKTVGPDPASARIAVDKKGWILATIFTGANNKGAVAGFTVELEKNESIASLEALEMDLGKADYSAFPATRFSNWSLSVWKAKGIVAAVQGGSRPVVQKVLLARPDVLAKNLDLWDRDATRILPAPRLEVSGFDVSATCNPKDRGLQDDMDFYLRRRVRRLMDGDGGPGWEPSRDGNRIRVEFSVKKGSKDTTLSGSVAASYSGPLGNFSYTESDSETVDRDLRDRVEGMFDRLMSKIEQNLVKKFERQAWQTEWRQFTGLCRPKA